MMTTNNTASMASVQPFQFQPVRTGIVVNSLATENTAHENEHEVLQRGEEARVGLHGWCRCNNCQPMMTERESVCCKELHFLTGAVQGEQIDKISVVV